MFASMTLALEQLERLGIPRQLEASYGPEDAISVLRGQARDSTVIDAVHGKLALNAGGRLIDLLIQDAGDLGWLRERIAVRTLLFGESSASFLSFSDDSHAILVSRALQESLVGMANLLIYLDVATGLAKNSSLRRRKRQKASQECIGRVTAALRYLLLGQRMTGRAPRTPMALDEESFQFAGQIAIGAVMFVIAHEIAHIVHGHTESSTRAYKEEGGASISEAQELQADSWALSLLMRLLSIDSQEPSGTPGTEVALWSAFTAIFATQITEKAIYVRRSRTHPEAWARWAVLEKQAPGAEEKADSLRLAFMMSAAGAMSFGEEFPDALWPLLQTDPMLGIEEEIDLAKLRNWDRLNSAPLDQLVSETDSSLTADGRALVGALRVGDLAEGLGGIGVPSPRLERILDPSLALEFSAVKGALEKGSPALTNGDPDAFAVVATRLAAVHLEGGFNP